MPDLKWARLALPLSATRKLPALAGSVFNVNTSRHRDPKHGKQKESHSVARFQWAAAPPSFVNQASPLFLVARRGPPCVTAGFLP